MIKSGFNQVESAAEKKLRQMRNVLHISLLCFLAIPVDINVESAAIIEDQTGTWEAAGMADSLVAAHDNILSEELFQMVKKEALIFQANEAEERLKKTNGGGYAHGKGGTFWFPLFTPNGEKRKPRFAIEAAIHLIYEIDFAGARPDRVVGAEWWVQHRQANEDITFHHDKDEGMASIKSTMRFPECGTVTYLTETGGPTLIFNQTTPDGNRDVPVIPYDAALSYPKRNRHIVFRGNLQHGVVGALALSEDDTLQLRAPRKRTTLLINWWVEKPMSPNCEMMPTQVVKKLGLYDKEGMAAVLQREYHHRPVPVLPAALVIPKSAAARFTHVVPLAGHDVLWCDLPHDMHRGLWKIRWAPGQIAGNAARLDLSRAQWVFAEPRPKLVVFISPGPQEDAVLGGLLRLSVTHQERIKLVLADPAATQDALGFFGLTRRDPPTAVIHVTHPDTRKHLMPRGEAFTVAAVERFLVRFLAGRMLGPEDVEYQ